jgi:L-rhamnose-H+ transport protein
MAFREILLLIIVAGLMNGSFVIPSKFIKASQEKVWLYHSIIGMGIIPWLLLWLFMPKEIAAYSLVDIVSFVFLIFAGVIFGVGQVCFAYAIEKIGIALSFTVNIGIGLVLGSLSVILYKNALFTHQGYLAVVAIIMILVALAVHYSSGKMGHNNKSTDIKHYSTGWLLVLFTGLTSGLQNFVFVYVGFHAESTHMFTNAYWVWPPFLTAAAIPMFIGFFWRVNKRREVVGELFAKSGKSLALVCFMGLLFTGSLLLYSIGMSHLTSSQHIIGWPAFMVSIILISQLWGFIFKESQLQLKIAKLLSILSTAILIAAIVVLTFAQ